MGTSLSSRRVSPDADPPISLEPPDFHREAEAPTQAEAQRFMFQQAARGGSWAVPSADPVEGTGFTAQDFYRTAAGGGSHGRPIRPSVHELFSSWGHLLPEEFFQDFEFAVKDIISQLLVLAFRVHSDITRPEADWADDGVCTRQQYTDGAFQRDTTGYHARLPEWQFNPPPGHVQPQPSLVEAAFAAMGAGTDLQRANAAGVQAAAHSINPAVRGAVGYAPYLDRDKWSRTLESFPPNMVPPLALAASAAQHSVRDATMSNMSIAANAHAGRTARAALKAAQEADISALCRGRAAIAGCEAQLATLHVMLATHAEVSPQTNEVYFTLQRMARCLGAPAGS